MSPFLSPQTKNIFEDDLKITSLTALILFVTIFEDNIQIYVIYLSQWEKTVLRITSKFMSFICHIFEDDLQIPFPAPDTCGGNEALENLLKSQKRHNSKRDQPEEVTGETF